MRKESLKPESRQNQGGRSQYQIKIRS